MVGHVDRHVEVAGWAAVGAGSALSFHPDPGAVGDSLRDLHLHGLSVYRQLLVHSRDRLVEREADLGVHVLPLGASRPCAAPEQVTEAPEQVER